MYSLLKISFVLQCLSTVAFATPVPVPQGRIIGAQLTPQQICALNMEDSSTWTISGAAFFLDDFVQRNGAKDWANKLDRMTTGDGTVASNRDCVNLLLGNCPAPSVQCMFFTPPEYYLIQQAQARVHSLLQAYMKALQIEVIDQILSISTVIADFGQPPPEPAFNAFGVVSGALGIASGLTGGHPLISGSLGVLSGVFNILSAQMTADPNANVQQDVDVLLRTIFDNTRGQISKLGATIFGGESDTSMLSRISPPASNMEVTDVARYFSGGRFLIPATTRIDEQITAQVTRWGVQIRQALAIRALKSQGWFVFIDTAAQSQEACSPAGSRFINGVCYKLVRVRDMGFAGRQMEDIPSDVAVKLDNTDYQIDVVQFYLNNEACRRANPTTDGQVQAVNLPMDGSYPQCFFNMDVKRGRLCATVCSSVNSIECRIGLAIVDSLDCRVSDLSTVNGI